MIKKGTRLEITVEGQTNTFLPLDEADLRGGVIDILSHKFAVNSINITPRASVYVGLIDWPYRSLVSVTTTTDYASANDVASIIANAFYEVGGSLPTVQVNGYGPPQRPGVTDLPEGPGLGTGVFLFGLAAIAVAIVVWKKT